ncbi:MAG: NUDIX hydrolase [Gammaproteobacteria bacterium]
MSCPAIEQLEVFDEQGRPCGRAPRSAVHREGLWHRAANVFLFVDSGRLLIQRRALDKDVCPGAWDLSVAEHLAPGESFEQGARRGLREELGLVPERLECLGEVVRSRLDMPVLGLKDYEFQQSFRATFTGEIVPDPDEVMDTRVVSLIELEAAFVARPEDFTPWFRQRVAALSIFESGRQAPSWGD